MKDMFKAYFQDHGASWVELLPLIEFTYNNNYYTTIKMTLYEALYDKRSHSPLHWDVIGERDVLVHLIGLEITQKIIKDVKKIRQKMK